mmetsp:Transcript_24269/g.43018  ORF Transcript_24269/g.43018 Transcript_24269/m.43018 type:complete len:298 (+) Transcript_24269:273-1166(+)
MMLNTAKPLLHTLQKMDGKHALRCRPVEIVSSRTQRPIDVLPLTLQVRERDGKKGLAKASVNYEKSVIVGATQYTVAVTQMMLKVAEIYGLFLHQAPPVLPVRAPPLAKVLGQHNHVAAYPHDPLVGLLSHRLVAKDHVCESQINPPELPPVLARVAAVALLSITSVASHVSTSVCTRARAPKSHAQRVAAVAAIDPAYVHIVDCVGLQTGSEVRDDRLKLPRIILYPGDIEEEIDLVVLDESFKAGQYRSHPNSPEVADQARHYHRYRCSSTTTTTISTTTISTTISNIVEVNGTF